MSAGHFQEIGTYNELQYRGVKFKEILSRDFGSITNESRSITTLRESVTQLSSLQ